MFIGFDPMIERCIEWIRAQFFPAIQVERRLIFGRRKFWSGSGHKYNFRVARGGRQGRDAGIVLVTVFAVPWQVSLRFK